MSAYVVSKDEIDILVTAGIHVVEDEYSVPDEQASEVGQRLLDECVRSVSYRYPNDDLGELPGTYDEETIVPGIAPVSIAQWLTPYAFTRPEREPSRDDVAEAISCYEYQSCEHPEWEASWARSYCLGLTAQLSRLPQRVTTPAEPEPDPAEFQRLYGDLSRDETIKRIRAALKRRSGKTWSVTGGRGTAWGWIHITAPPKRRVSPFGYMTEADQIELADLLGKDRPVHCQGESIPASSEYRREYIDRAEGREPGKYGTQYWD